MPGRPMDVLPATLTPSVDDERAAMSGNVGAEDVPLPDVPGAYGDETSGGDGVTYCCCCCIE